MGKSYTRLKTKKPQKPYADGAAHAPPPPPPLRAKLQPKPLSWVHKRPDTNTTEDLTHLQSGTYILQGK